jgi:class 3 adenylate cyclase/tetratricopeptide (TPR) repeat protein
MVAPAEARPIVTLVTSDLKGSTALGERLDPEALREVLNRYFGVMRAVFESHGGQIEKIIGDAIVAVFGLPEPAEDDALRAVEAAAESMRALATLNDELEAGWGVRLVTRTGVASGEVTFGPADEGQHVLLGTTVDVSGVMEQNAPPLEVLVHESTIDLVRASVDVEAVEPVSPKGSAERLVAYRLVSVREREGREARATTSADAGSKDTRRTVSIVFALAKVRAVSGEEPGPGLLRDVMSVYFDGMRTALEHHGGTVEKYIGDAVMAVFGLPIRHEDDALRAVRAAADMQTTLEHLNNGFRSEFGVELESHIGVNTGEVIATGDATTAQRLVTGDTVNTAARLEQAAGPGEIVLGDLTYRLARDGVEVEGIPPLTLKGKAEPVPAHRLVRVGAPGTMETASVSTSTPFVGRIEELHRLAVLLATAQTERRAKLISVVGDAGVGKSRLIRQFASDAGSTTQVLRGRCLPYGNGITFWPLAEAVREAGGIESEDTPAEAIEKLERLVASAADDAPAIVARVAAAINLSTAQFPVPELLWGARRLLETLARERPLTLIVDDLHSAEETFLDLLDHVVEASDDAPIVLLCSARHELAERHPEWAATQADATITLLPLSDDDSRTIVEELLGSLESSVRARIADAAEGNPLYLEQIVSMLVETKAIERDGDRWVARRTGEQLAIPPTVQALVAARLDALDSDERSVIEPASVIGLSFPEDALEELVDRELQSQLDFRLTTLSGKQLIRPAGGADVVYRFGHLVIRDTAYGGLLKRVRAALHERFVVWAERVNRERGREIEFEEILGYHLEQAYRYRTDLGLVDEAARAVGERAALKLSNAGRRALARADLPAAVSLLSRTAALVRRDSDFRMEILVDLAEAQMLSGAFDDAAAVLDEAIATADDVGSARFRARALLIKVAVDQQRTSGEGGAQRGIDVAREAIAVLEPIDDFGGLARAWRLVMATAALQGRTDDAVAAAERIIHYASRANEHRLAARSSGFMSFLLLRGGTALKEALPQCEQLLESVRGDRAAEAGVRSVVAVMCAMQGSIDEARRIYKEAYDALLEVGTGVITITSSIDSSRVERLAGDPEAAERELRRDYDALGAIGETYYRSTIGGLLAHVLHELGRDDEALEIAEVARSIGDEDDAETQVEWRSAMARALAAKGLAAEAIRLSTEAVEAIAGGSDVIVRLDALTALGEVYQVLGDEERSGPPLREALTICDQKGDVVTAARIRTMLQAVATA